MGAFCCGHVPAMLRASTGPAHNKLQATQHCWKCPSRDARSLPACSIQHSAGFPVLSDAHAVGCSDMSVKIHMHACSQMSGTYAGCHVQVPTATVRCITFAAPPGVPHLTLNHSTARVCSPS